MATRKSRGNSNHRTDMFHEAVAIASTFAEGSKHSAAERIAKIASATRSMTYSFEDVPYLRDYAVAAADGLDGLAGYVDDTSVAEMVDQLSAFAKRQPMATLALTVAAGFVTSQFVRGWGPNGTPSATGARRSKRKSSRRRGGKH